MVNPLRVISVVGIILMFVGVMMIFPWLISLLYNEGDSAALLWSVIITILLGLTGYLIGRRQKDIGLRDGFAVVTLGWLAMAFAGALPFYFSGAIPTFTDSMFESMSGLSTTGASILGTTISIESLPHGILFWRSLTQWIGGMGIILLSLAILPLLKVGGMQLYRAEFPGPVKDKLTPRIRDTAEILWVVYLLFSAIAFILLMVGGMSAFDAACHSFTTMSSGGFSTYDSSIGAFDSKFIHYVIIVFMIISGVNFALHYRLLRGNPKMMWVSIEFRIFMILIATFTATVMTINLLRHQFGSFEEIFRYSLFNVVSIITTTGYSTTDWAMWGGLVQVIMIMMMLIGGMAGSTSGSIKIIRIQILLKQIQLELRRLIHPNAVLPLRIGNSLIEKGIARNVMTFLLVFAIILIASTAIIAATGYDLVTSFGASISCLANIGPGIGQVGPSQNYSHFPQFVKWMLVSLMMLGRLEIFTVLVIFSRHYWRM